MQICSSCNVKLPANCFRKGRKDCVWCQFSDPSFRAEWRYKDKLRQKRWPVHISKEDFVKWYIHQPDECHYCKTPYTDLKKLQLPRFNGRYVSWDIDRIDSSKPYQEGNLVLACFICNSTKSNLLTEHETMHIGKSIRQVLLERIKNQQSG